jgi:hypothetical protein
VTVTGQAEATVNVKSPVRKAGSVGAPRVAAGPVGHLIARTTRYASYDITFGVPRVGGAEGAATVNRKVDGPGSEAWSGTLRFADGSTYATIKVTGVPPTAAPADFKLTFSNSTGRLKLQQKEYTFHFLPPALSPTVGGGAFAPQSLMLEESEATAPALPFDSDKDPFWGLPSAASDDAYSLVVEGDGRPLYLNYHGLTGGTVTGGTPVQVEICAPLPAAPAQLAASGDSASKAITLNWQPTADESTEYLRIERKADGESKFHEIATVPAGGSSYVDADGIQLDTKYTYRVIAHGRFGDSAASNVAYAAALNQAPAVTVPQALTVQVGQEFTYTLAVSDVEDDAANRDLNYSLLLGLPTDPTLPSDPRAALAIGSDGTIHGWTPTASDVGAYALIAKVTDSDGASTYARFLLKVVKPTPEIPAITSASASSSVVTGTQVDLTVSATMSGHTLRYQWTVAAQPEGADAPLLSNGGPSKSPSTTATFSAAGICAFEVSVWDENSTDPDAVNTAQVSVLVRQTSSHIRLVGVPSTDVPFDQVPFPATFTGGAQSFNIGQNGAQSVIATVYDQFGHPMEEVNDRHPGLDWTFAGTTDNSHTNVGYEIDAGNVAGTYPLTVTLPERSPDEPAVPVTVDVIVPDLASPALALSRKDNGVYVPADPAGTPPAIAMDFAGESLDLMASITNDFGEDLSYEWSVVSRDTGTPLPTFGPNRSDEAAATAVTFGMAGTYVLAVTAKDTGAHPGLQSTLKFTVHVQAVASGVSVTPNHPVARLGQTLASPLQATVVDQFGRAWATQPDDAGFHWSVLPGGGGGTPGSATGRTYTYTAPASLPSGTLALADTIEVSATVGVVTLTGRTTVLSQEYTSVLPVTKITTTAGSGGRLLVDRDLRLQGVVDDPEGDPVTYRVTAVPQDRSGEPNPNPITIYEGTGGVGARPSSGDLLATIRPTMLSDGFYKIVLSATDDNHTDDWSQDSIEVEVRTQLKLGNLTLPVTDLTISRCRRQRGDRYPRLRLGQHRTERPVRPRLDARGEPAGRADRADPAAAQLAVRLTRVQQFADVHDARREHAHLRIPAAVRRRRQFDRPQSQLRPGVYRR